MRPPEGKPSSRTTPIASSRNTSQELSISWTAVLATATESGSIAPRGGSPDCGTGCHASPPPISGHVASR